MKPRIGVTSGGTNVTEYLSAVETAGGTAVHLAPTDSAPASALAGLDGIVFSGGVDVDPARYGAAPHPLTDAPSQKRDDFEFALVRAAFERCMPTLAICRGLQVANVAFGGSLHQHVPDVVGERIPHRVLTADGRALRGLVDAHTVTIEADSRLAALAGTACVTGSRHHQSVDRVADGFRVVARTADGIVEALEPADAAWFWLGVQWHPESTLGLDAGASAKIFAALIAAAAGAATARSRPDPGDRPGARR